jgi:hypothetical protein
VPGYGVGYGTPGTFGISGNTVYARTAYQKADLYNMAADIGATALLFGQQQYRLASDSQAYGDKAHERYAALSERHQELLRILVKSESAAKLFKSVIEEPSRAVIQNKTVEQFIQPQRPTGLLPRANDEARSQQFGETVGNYCGKCHGANPQNIKGGLDLRNWPSFTQQQKEAVAVRVNLPLGDPKHMPPAAEPQLDASAKAQFSLN